LNYTKRATNVKYQFSLTRGGFFGIVLTMETQTQPVIRIRLKELLSEKGWLQKEMAEITGISRTTISGMHTAKMIRFETLATLVEATGWPIERLLEYRS